MIYVALLRGINVGGKNKIDMKNLKETFERVGMKSVKTYINSGNVIFENSIETKDDLIVTLEKAIFEDFSLGISVLIRSINDFHALIEALPANWKNDNDMKSDVLFLWEDIDEATILNKLTIKPGIDTIIHVPGALLWSITRKERSKSGIVKLVGNQLYKKMTIRNVNTVRKIYHIMQEKNNELVNE